MRIECSTVSRCGARMRLWDVGLKRRLVQAQNGVVEEREEVEGMQLRTRKEGLRLQRRDLVGGQVTVEEERGRRGFAVQPIVGVNNFVEDRGGVMGLIRGVSL